MVKRLATSLLTLSLGSALLVGCGAQQLDPATPGGNDPPAEAIVGGTPDTGDPAIVALYGKQPGATKGALCTATVISPTVVLTAAHCVDPSVVGTGLEYNVLLAPNLTDKNNPSPKVAVKETHFDPLFSHTNLTNGHDIGVAILATPVTIPPIPFNRNALTANLVNQLARIVGYGLDNGFAQTGAGIKRQATVKLNSFDDKLVHTGNFFQKICNGDSGGPVLMNLDGQETVVGVNSFGLIFCLGDGLSTRVDLYTSFVDPYLH